MSNQDVVYLPVKGSYLCKLAADHEAYLARKRERSKISRLNQKLRKAALDGDVRKVKDLLDRGAEVHSHDMNGRSALTHACIGGHLRVVKLLLDNEAFVKKIGNWARYWLRSSVQASIALSRLSIIKFFYSKGFLDDDALALAMDKPSIFNFLLNKGFDLQPALELAIKQGRLDFAKHLIEHGAPVTDSLFVSVVGIKDMSVEVIQFLIEHGANVNANVADHFYESGPTTALERAMRRRNKPVVKALLAAGASKPLEEISMSTSDNAQIEDECRLHSRQSCYGCHPSTPEAKCLLCEDEEACGQETDRSLVNQ